MISIPRAATFLCALALVLPNAGWALGQEEAKAEPNPALLNPALAGETAPEKFRVELDTTKGKIVLEVGLAVAGVRLWRGPSASLAERAARVAARKAT